MRILHVYKTALPFSVGGVETHIDSLASAQVRAGHQVEVLATAKGCGHQKLQFNGYTVHYTKAYTTVASTPISLSFFFHFQLLKNKFDIIHFHYPYPVSDLCFLTSLPRPKAIVTYHSDIIKQRLLRYLYAPFMHIFLKRIDRVVATSPQYLKSSVVLQKYKHKVQVVPLGLPDLASTQCMRETKTLEHQPYFLFLGEFRYYKGIKWLLEAARSVRCKILLAGNADKLENIIDQIAGSGMDNVVLLGAVSQETRNELLAGCIGVVLPSDLRSEAFGLSLLEGAIFSKPLISCEIGTGTTYVNVNGETGIVVEPGSSEQLAEAMNTLLENPRMAKEMGEASRSRYENNFTIEATHTMHEAVYLELTGGKK